jgi:hypothetical protein
MLSVMAHAERKHLSNPTAHSSPYLSTASS